MSDAYTIRNQNVDGNTGAQHVTSTAICTAPVFDASKNSADYVTAVKTVIVMLQIFSDKNSPSKIRAHVHNLEKIFSENENLKNDAAFSSEKNHFDKFKMIFNMRKDLFLEIFDVAGYKAKSDEIVNSTNDVLSEVKTTVKDMSLDVKATSAKLQAACMAEGGNKKISTSSSYFELWDVIAIAIGSIQKNYVNVYTNLMQSFTDLFQSFNNSIQKASGDAITSSDDANKVKFNAQKMDAAYTKFNQEIEKLEKNISPVDGWEAMDDEAKQTARTTMAPAFNIDDNGKITFNLSQYREMSRYPAGYPSGERESDVSTSTYQAWLASFNSVTNSIQSNMQSFLQRTTQAKTNFDNLNKVLSGAISALADLVKDVFKSIS
ncbi:IpaD/SipD/SspD family type III secretion system needle tip protein [Erwinia papayae]|uniref:IpaD/SipD/SspD family type III secretion system needle tip protein n=1 Tax=Erwinia papayae TaxID=206499 RepID=A0ABV3N3X1_9GAMM